MNVKRHLASIEDKLTQPHQSCARIEPQKCFSFKRKYTSHWLSRDTKKENTPKRDNQLVLSLKINFYLHQIGWEFRCCNGSMPAAGKQNDHTFMWYYDICIGETHWNVVISCWDCGTWLFFWGLWISHLQSVLVSCLGLKWGERRWGRWRGFFCDACRKKNPS